MVRLVADRGLEHALAELHAAGVYLTLDEFKGRRPIVRPGGLEVTTSHRTSTTPSCAAATRGGAEARAASRAGRWSTSGTTSSRRRRSVSCSTRSASGGGRSCSGGRRRRGAPASATRCARCFRLPVEWYSQSRVGFRDVELRDWIALRTALVETRLRHLGARAALRAVGHRADEIADASASSLPPGRRRSSTAPRAPACGSRSPRRRRRRPPRDVLPPRRRAAHPRGRSTAVERVGGRAYANYARCPSSVAPASPARDRPDVDDVHVLTGRVAVLLRPTADPRFDVQALLLTTLLPSGAEADAQRRERRHGRPVRGRLRLRDRRRRLPRPPPHDPQLREADQRRDELPRLDLVDVVENVLPAASAAARPTTSSSRTSRTACRGCGCSSAPSATSTRGGAHLALASLGEGPGYRQMMAGIWRDGATLTVERAEPVATPSAKVQAFHVMPRP